MLNGLADLGHAYLGVMNFWSLLFGLGGALIGIIVGCMPGLVRHALHRASDHGRRSSCRPTMRSLILICSYVGTLYGGSRTAILLNIPGTAANAASCADGHALALRGEAGRAIGIATSGAFTSTLFGVLCLAAFTPVAGRGCAVVRRLRIFLARAVRRRHVGQHCRRRSAEGLADGMPRVCSSRRSARTASMLMIALHSAAAIVGRNCADPRAGRCVRLLGGSDHARRSVRAQDRRNARLRAAALSRSHPILADRSALRRHRRPHRPDAGRRRGRGRLDVLCRGQSRQQGEGAVRQGLDRRSDGGRNRRHGFDSRPHHSLSRARHSRLRAVGGVDVGDDHPWHPARTHDDDRSSAIRL